MTNALLIKIRDKLLDGIAGKSATQVLNPSMGDTQPELGSQPAAELKKALDRIRVATMEEGGTGVDYGLMRNDLVFVEFQKVSSPGLRCFDLALLSTRQEKMAFWINLYNALVLNAVIHFGVQSSITEGRLGILAFSGGRHITWVDTG